MEGVGISQEVNDVIQQNAGRIKTRLDCVRVCGWGGVCYQEISGLRFACGKCYRISHDASR